MKLSTTGQIQTGDTILCDYKGRRLQYSVDQVLNPGTDKEEIIVDNKTNKYFITSMVLDGTSWAKNVNIIKSGKEHPVDRFYRKMCIRP